MKTNSLLFLSLFATGVISSLAGPPPKTSLPPPPPPPPVVKAPSPSSVAENHVYEQKPISGRPVLVTPEQAKAVIDRFKAAYPKLGNPRMLIYVNRELIDEQSGLKLASRTEQTESSRTKADNSIKPDSAAAAANNTASKPAPATGGAATENGSAHSGSAGSVSAQGKVFTHTNRVKRDNVYRAQDRNPVSLADKQTMRDVERLFGRPLRMAGASLADQRVATQLMTDKPLKAFTDPTEGAPARKDRAALAKIADVVLEILISSRNVTVPEISSDKVYSVPDIQATAIRLSDSKILGQATSSDIIGQGRSAGHVARNADVREIAEATALALMEDMMLGVSQ